MTLLDSISFSPFRFRHFVSGLLPKSPFTYTPKRPKSCTQTCNRIAPAMLLRHGLKAEDSSSSKPNETIKTDSPTISKWQIGLFLWQKPARREPERSAASAKRAGTSYQGSRGAAPGAPLVTFPATGKSPGCRAERLHIRGGRGHRPRIKPPGVWGGAPIHGRGAEGRQPLAGFEAGTLGSVPI